MARATEEGGRDRRAAPRRQPIGALIIENNAVAWYPSWRYRSTSSPTATVQVGDDAPRGTCFDSFVNGVVKMRECNAARRAEIKKRSTRRWTDVSPAVPDWFRGDHRRVWREGGSIRRRSHSLAGRNDITAPILTVQRSGPPFASNGCHAIRAARNFNEMVHGELKGIFYFHRYIIFGICEIN